MRVLLCKGLEGAAPVIALGFRAAFAKVDAM